MFSVSNYPHAARTMRQSNGTGREASPLTPVLPVDIRPDVTLVSVAASLKPVNCS